MDIFEDGLRFSWVTRSVVVTASVSWPLLQQVRKYMDMMNTRTSRRPAPSMDRVWQRLPGHPTVVCVSAAHGTYWGSKTSLMRARRSLSESTLASWCTSRDVVSESSRKLKSLHSTGKEKTTKNVTTRRQNEHRTCDWWNLIDMVTYHFGFELGRPRAAGYNQQPRRKNVKDSVQISVNRKLLSATIYAFFHWQNH